MDQRFFKERRQKAREIYDRQKTIYSPYFKSDIIMNSDGFHHLQFSARRERNKEEQILKFNLLPLGLEIIRRAATLQEYRKGFCLNEKTGLMRPTEWWGFSPS